MKPVINRNDVAEVMESLKKAGKNPTIAAIHAGLGGRGSITTVIKLRAEIDADSAIERDNEQASLAFREFWGAAVAVGKKDREDEIGSLQNSINALTGEIQALEGAAIITASTISKVEAQRDSLLLEQAEFSKQATAARAIADQLSGRLTAALEKMEELRAAQAVETKELRDSLHQEQQRNRNLEIQLSKAEATIEHQRPSMAKKREKAE